MAITRRTYAGRAIGFARKQVLGIGQRVRDQINPSYCLEYPSQPLLTGYIKPLRLELLLAQETKLRGLAANHLAHRFDLLGSGWLQVRHGMRCLGVEGNCYGAGETVSADSEGRWLAGRVNRPNLLESQRIWGLVERGYQPVDWQLDFKSGYRWSESAWYLDIPYGHKPGVDIKVPWEMARMQHLPRLAFAYALARSGAAGFAAPDRYFAEMRNQILDFIATNPPRFGVNWRSAMEVSIRAANWLVAVDLFRAAGAGLDLQFETVLTRSLYEHGLHLESNLEWDPEVRGNHYLANVVGMLFIAAYLPWTPKTDAWLAFAVREFINEADFQFAPDGSHREASTSYHCLTAEMIAYATALVLGLPADKREALRSYDYRALTTQPPLAPAPLPLYALDRSEARTPFPGWYFERLERMGEFVTHITKPGGCVPQIGDNDSGRFIRLDGAQRQMTVAQARAHYANLCDYNGLPDDATYWDEVHLDHRGLAAAVGALFKRDDLLGAAGAGALEAGVIDALCAGVHPVSYRQRGPANTAETVRVGSPDQLRALRQELCAHRGARRYDIPASPGADLRNGLACWGYPDFGLYVMRSTRLYLAVRCGRFGMVGNGGHAHHDQLSIELSLDGCDVIFDPGTYLYSALAERRYEYRAAFNHFAPQIEDRAAQGAGPGLFQMRDRAAAQCLYFGPQGFAGCHNGFGIPVWRVIEIDGGSIHIIDAIKGGEGRVRELTPAFGYRCGWRESLRPSPGYGTILNDPELTI